MAVSGCSLAMALWRYFRVFNPLPVRVWRRDSASGVSKQFEGYGASGSSAFSESRNLVSFTSFVDNGAPRPPSQRTGPPQQCPRLGAGGECGKGKASSDVQWIAPHWLLSMFSWTRDAEYSPNVFSSRVSTGCVGCSELA